MHVTKTTFYQEAIFMLILGGSANDVPKPLEIHPCIGLVAYRLGESNKEVKMPRATGLTLPAANIGTNTKTRQGRSQRVEAARCLCFFRNVFSEGQGQFGAVIFTAPLPDESFHVFLDGKSLFGPVRSKLVRIRV